MVITDTIKSGQIDSAPLFQDNLSISSQAEFLGLDRFSSRGQLHDIIPPPNSLAAEILGKSPSLTFTAGKSIFSNIRDIQESLSDFASANDSVSDASVEPSSSSDDTALKKDQNQGFRTANDKKRSKRYKRKLALTPSKEDLCLRNLITKQVLSNLKNPTNMIDTNLYRIRIGTYRSRAEYEIFMKI